MGKKNVSRNLTLNRPLRNIYFKNLQKIKTLRIKVQVHEHPL